MAALTVQNAEIKTATVEVRTLTISGKQVTLAVFRQLVESDWLDSDDAHPRGPAWGTVNYHPDRCGDEAEHLHVVWQEESELRRSKTFRAPWRGERFWEHELDVYVAARFCVSGHNWVALSREGFTIRQMRRERDVHFTMNGTSCVANEPDQHLARCERTEAERVDFAVEAEKEAQKVVAAEQDRRRRWAAALESAGPQLFIAV